jgi:transposase
LSKITMRPGHASGSGPPRWHRDGQDRAAPGRLGVQAAPLGAVAQGPGPAGVGKKRLRVEALLAAAASPLPPPACDLIPDATLAADLFPQDLPRLLELLGHADLYLQDEVEVALHPTLTRVWSRAGRSGQRLVQAPGKNYKQCGFGLVDWREGSLDWALAEGRRAVPFCEQLRRAVARSRSRGRIAMVILDNLGIHTPKGSRLLRALLAELGEQLVLVYTPTYDPDANRIEWLWRALRRAVTHTHQRQTLAELLADAQAWAHSITPAEVLSQIGSPFASDQQPTVGEELNHAA